MLQIGIDPLIANVLTETTWGAWLSVLIAAAVGVAVHFAIFLLLRQFARRSDTSIDDAFVNRLRWPSAIILALLAVRFIMPWLETLDRDQQGLLGHAMSLVLITGIVWLIIAIVQAGAQLIREQHDITAADNYAARRMHTQVNVIARVLVIVAVIVGVGLGLMTFPSVRQIGTSLLASAGIAGIIIGFAARPVLENIIGGVQLALTQPIAIDDVVIVEGEWGRIEQITATYVVVKIWDERRLIVPFSKFISEPFQNWTRRTADILGTVFIYADYTVPVQAIRDELQKIVDGHEKWDGKVCNVQVTDATEQTMQIRALVSAANSGNAWELRVHVREKLIEFLQREYPESLPRSRISLEEAGTEASGRPSKKKTTKKKKTS